MKKSPLLLLALLGWAVLPAVVAADKPTTTVVAPPAKPAAVKGATAGPATQTAPKTTAPAAKPVAKPEVKPGAKPEVKPDAKPEAKTAAKPETKPAAKEEPLVGKLLDRPGGGFLNFKVDAGNFVVRFLDAEKKETSPDLARAIVRYRQHLQNRQHILVTSGGKILRAPTPVIRPYRFPKLSLVLFKEGSETAAEAYTIYFNQPMPGDGKAEPADEMAADQLEKAAK